MAETDISARNSKPWQFKPGQSGNPAGRPPGTSEQAAMKKVLANVAGVGAALIAEVLADEETLCKLKVGMMEQARNNPKCS